MLKKKCVNLHISGTKKIVILIIVRKQSIFFWKIVYKIKDFGFKKKQDFLLADYGCGAFFPLRMDCIYIVSLESCKTRPLFFTVDCWNAKFSKEDFYKYVILFLRKLTKSETNSQNINFYCFCYLLTLPISLHKYAVILPKVRKVRNFLRVIMKIWTFLADDVF